MFGTLFGLLNRGKQVWDMKAENLHLYLILVVMALFGIWTFMWVVNILPNQWTMYFNIPLTIALLGFFFFLGFSPQALEFGGLAGLVAHLLQDQDLTQGLFRGLVGVARFTIGIVWATGIISALLCFIEFSPHPFAFWGIVIMSVLFAATLTMNSRLASAVTLVLALVVLVPMSWQLVPAGTFGKEKTPEMVAEEEWRKVQALNSLEEKQLVHIVPGRNTWEVSNDTCANFPDKRVPTARSRYSDKPGKYRVVVDYSGTPFETVMLKYPLNHPKCG